MAQSIGFNSAWEVTLQALTPMEGRRIRKLLLQDVGSTVLDSWLDDDGCGKGNPADSTCNAMILNVPAWGPSHRLLARISSQPPYTRALARYKTQFVFEGALVHDTCRPWTDTYLLVDCMTPISGLLSTRSPIFTLSGEVLRVYPNGVSVGWHIWDPYFNATYPQAGVCRMSEQASVIIDEDESDTFELEPGSRYYAGGRALGTDRKHDLSD